MGDFQLLGVLNVEGEGASGNEFYKSKHLVSLKNLAKYMGVLDYIVLNLFVSVNILFSFSLNSDTLLNMHVN